MSTTININGEILKPEDAKISVFDRGFLFGDSIYEVTYSKNRTFIFLDEHLDRLWNSALLIGMDIQIERDELISRILVTAKAADIENCYVRVVITRGEGEPNLAPTELDQNVVIFVKPNVVYPEHQYTKGLKLVMASRFRNDRRCLDPNAKSGNYLNNVLAVQEAKRAGADDAILANIDGNITEGSTFNVWMVKNGVARTPHHSSGLLKGITRQKVLELCESEGFECVSDQVSVEDLMGAEEVFITSSTKGVMPVYQIGETLFAQSKEERPVTEKIAAKYNELIDTHVAQRAYRF